MTVGDIVKLSPYLTHFPDWVIGRVKAVENNPFRRDSHHGRAGGWQRLLWLRISLRKGLEL